MKLKVAVTEGAPPALFKAFGSAKFAKRFNDEVAKPILGARAPGSRPAEYYVQKPDETIAVEEGVWGAEARLTGVSRSGRESKVFHDARDALDRIVRETTEEALEVGQRVQTFTVVMIDGDVETKPGSGVYSNTLESEPQWVIKQEPEETAG